MVMAYSHALFVIWNFDDYPQSHLYLGKLMKTIWPNGNGIGKKKIIAGMNTRFGWVVYFQQSSSRHSKYFKSSGQFSSKIKNFGDQDCFQRFFSRYLNYSSARNLSPPLYLSLSIWGEECILLSRSLRFLFRFHVFKIFKNVSVQ